ncbi:MAG TPA: pyridoxamine 5'-phosphate oxidase family protein, partial [Bacillota bacterium]|nr:pyridoxamine 5'-phosphate oxidase family protein [Bacillota bacterium]
METVDKKLLQEANEFLTTQNTGFLATNGSAGLRVSPVSIFMGDELKVYIHCFGGDKMTNLSENPEACLLVIEGKDTFDAGIYQGVQVFGRAREIAKGTDDHHKAEIWCPYTHDEDLTLL